MRKKNKSREERDVIVKRRKKIALVAAACMLFYVTLSFFLGEMGFIRYTKLCRQRDQIKAEIVALKESNQTLRERVESLRTDPDSIEVLAREQGLVKDGETVYQYEDE